MYIYDVFMSGILFMRGILWLGEGLDPCPPAWQTGPLPTELTRWWLAQLLERVKGNVQR